jgi:hypothetical protein
MDLKYKLEVRGGQGLYIVHFKMLYTWFSRVKCMPLIMIVRVN